MAEKFKDPAEVVPLKIRKCPICGKPAKRVYQPFCSDHCADVDLGRWLNEGYRIPTNEAPDELAEDDAGDEDGAPGKR